MPSGSKKRKAAKKKKEKEASIDPSTNNSQVNEEVKSQDEKGSDSGEIGSPGSPDERNNHHNPFNGGNEELEKNDQTMERVPTDDMAPNQNAEFEDDGIVKVESELKSGEDSESTIVNIEHVESAKESYDSDDRSSSSDSSSSDDESRVTKTKSLEDKSPVELIQVTENESFQENIDLLVQTALVIDSVSRPELSVSEKTPENAASEKNSEASDVIALELEKVEETLLSIPDEATSVSVTSADLVSKESEDRALVLSSGFPVTEASNGAQHSKDSEIPERYENQPLIASAPRVSQRTSLFSCCGLFDVLTGSNR